MLRSTHPHAQLFDRIYRPTMSGDGPALLHVAITEPFIAHTAGHSPIGGTFVGLSAFTGHIALLRHLSGGTLRRASIGPNQLAEHWQAVADEAAWDAFWLTPAR